MGEILIRPAAPQDAAAIARVRVDSWRTTYAAILPQSYLANLRYETYTRHWSAILSAGGREGHAYVAHTAGNDIVGFILGGVNRANDPRFLAELYAVYLLQAHQQRGIGRQLVSTLAERLSQAGLTSMVVWVLAQNPARFFYERLDGKPAGERRLRLANHSLPEMAYGWEDIGILAE